MAHRPLDECLSAVEFRSLQVAGSVALVSSCTLVPDLLARDFTDAATTAVSTLALLNALPILTSTTGYTYDGVNSWTPNTCCYNNVPLAQADIGPSVATQDVDKTPGLMQWALASIVHRWLTDLSTNVCLLLNSDPSKLRDR